MIEILLLTMIFARRFDAVSLFTPTWISWVGFQQFPQGECFSLENCKIHHWGNELCHLRNQIISMVWMTQ